MRFATTPRAHPVARALAALAAAGLAACGGDAPPPRRELPAVDPARVAYDLVERFPAAGVRREVARLELGAPTARPYLVQGWSHDERDEERSFVWSVGEEALVDFFAAGGRDVGLVFHCRAFTFDGAPEQVMTVALNGADLGALTLGESFARHRLEAPSELLVPGRNRLRLRFAYHRVPSEVDPEQRDNRSLSAQWYEIAMEGLGSEAEPSAEAAPLPLLTLPFGTQVSYYLDLGPGESLELGDVVPWGEEADGARLVAELRTAGGTAVRSASFRAGAGEAPARVRVESRGRRITELTLTPQRPERRGLVARLAGLFGSGGEAGVAVVRPLVVAERTAESARGAQHTSGDAPRPERRPNVLVYLIDTLRADHLGAYGYERPVSPRIDAFAEDAVLFLDAQAQSSWTRTSVVSLLTGLNPQAHRVNQRDDALPQVIDTLAERLRDAGYATAGIITNGNVDRTFALDQGFDLYRYLPESRQRPEVHHLSDALNRAAFEWLASHDGSTPFFLYLHSTDPHAPYTPPEPFRSRFAAGVDPELGLIEHVHDISAGRRPAPPGTRDAWLDLYDAEIAFNDHHFGLLLDELRRLGLYDSTLIVLVSDHGEEFLEHGGWEHGKTLYAEQLQIPLVMRLPEGEAAGTRVEAIARQVDLVPTVLDLLGLEAPGELDGTSLLRLISPEAGSAGPRESFAYLSLDERRMESVAARGWKLIVDRSAHTRAGREQLFDYRNDPGERESLTVERPFELGFLHQALRNLEWSLRRRSGPKEADKAEIDEALRERLEALGYLDGG